MGQKLGVNFFLHCSLLTYISDPIHVYNNLTVYRNVPEFTRINDIKSSSYIMFSTPSLPVINRQKHLLHVHEEFIPGKLNKSGFVPGPVLFLKSHLLCSGTHLVSTFSQLVHLHRAPRHVEFISLTTSDRKKEKKITPDFKRVQLF